MGYVTYVHQKTQRLIERNNQQQAMNHERYRIITEQSGSIIFEFDMTTGSTFHTSNFKEKFGYMPTSESYTEGIAKKDRIHPEDRASFMKFQENMKTGKKYDETEVRMQRRDGTYLWMRIKETGIFDQDKKLLRIVGKMTDITEEKQQIENLKAKADKDSVTGVYNKQATQNLIESYLKGEGRSGQHALFVIDIDDFKGINDTWGHRQGDEIISFLAGELKNMFRFEDIVGRIGGDEFMVLIKNITDLELVAGKARSICHLYEGEKLGKDREVKASNSVGVAIYRRDGMTYEELYEAADNALYCCKDEGKGTFVFYNQPCYFT